MSLSPLSLVVPAALLAVTACAPAAASPPDAASVSASTPVLAAAGQAPEVSTNTRAATPSPVAATAERWLRTMTRTQYAHRYRIDPVRGVYVADCVGLADAVLRRAAPRAWADLHERLRIRTGYVPRPGRWLAFLSGERGPLPASWQRITRVDQLRPGDFLLMSSNPATRFVGHAVIVAGRPTPQPDGTFALRIIDATSSPHGDSDTRLTDPRSATRTGLGAGTLRLRADASGAIERAWWSTDGRGPSMRGVTIVAGRALR